MSTHLGGSFDCDFTHKSFLPNAIEDCHICNHKNGWFGQKSQMHGLEWIRLIVVINMYQHNENKII
jgi:hypothetical protein